MIGNVFIFVHNGKATTTSIVDGASVALDGYANDQTGQNQGGYHRRSAIADKGHCLSRHGNDVQNARSVDKELKREHEGRPLRNHTSLEIRCLTANLECSVDKHSKDC